MYDTGGNINNLGVSINNNGTNTIKPLEGTSLIITLCVLCPIVLVVVLGNLLVIISIFVDRSLRKPQNMYFVSLAVVDLLMGLCVLPFSVLHVLRGPVWTFGRFMCKFYLTLDMTLSMMSFFHLVAIAVDRYRSINEGVQYIQKITYRTVFTALAGVFIVSLWISLPPVLGWGWDKGDWWDDSTKCDILRSPGYVVYSAFGSLLFPMALMIYMYIQIYFTLSRKIREKARIKSLAHCHGHSRPVSYPEAITNRQSAFADVEIIAEETGTLSKKSQSQSSLRLPRNLSVKRLKSLARCRPVSNPYPCTGRQSAIVDVDVEINTGERETDTKPLKKSESSAILPRSLSVKRMLRSENNERFNREHTNMKEVNMSQEVLDFVALKQKFSLSQQRNAARTLGMIISGFLICWLPFCVVYVASPFLPDEFTPPDAVFIFVAWLAYLNSGLNPIIYTVFHKEFRNAFKKILFIT